MRRELLNTYRENKRLNEAMKNKESIRKYLQSGGKYKGTPRIEKINPKSKALKAKQK